MKQFLQIKYLPFAMGKDFCTILLVNEQVGEMVYAVEGEALLPVPTQVKLNRNSSHTTVLGQHTKKLRGTSCMLKIICLKILQCIKGYTIL